jgi:hypothetical protein
MLTGGFQQPEGAVLRLPSPSIEVTGSILEPAVVRARGRPRTDSTIRRDPS